MKRLILMALSFGLVTTVASAQNTNAEQETKSKSKSKTEMKKDKDGKSESEMKAKQESKDKAGKSEQKSKSKSESSDKKMDQGARSSSMNWNKSADNTWIGVDNYHYRVNSSGQLEKSQDGQAWRLSQSGRWQDDQGNFYRIKDNKLESSKDGSSWASCPDNSWKGRDNTMYKYSESEKSIYSSKSGDVKDDSNLDINDQRKDAAPSRGGDLDLNTPDSIDNRQPMTVPVDSANLNDQSPRRERKDGQIMNMQDEGMRNYNLETQDPMQDRRNGSLPQNGKNNDQELRKSPK